MTRNTKGLPTQADVDAANKLLDILIQTQNLKNDAALCRFLGIAPPVVSKLRRGRFFISGDLKILIHEKTGMSIAYIQAVLRVEQPVEENIA